MNESPGPAPSEITTPQTVPSEADAPRRVSDEARKAALSRQVATAVASQSARVESQSDYQAVLITGQKVNHVLHLLITIFTVGLWAIVWVVLAVVGGEKRHIVQVDEWGNVTVQHV